MNQEEALIHIRGLAERSTEVTRCCSLKDLKKHQQALKVLNKLIAQRAAKRQWRESCGQIPDHAKHPEHPLNKARGIQHEVRCGILGCGRFHSPEDSRTYRLWEGDKTGIPCCPSCWKSMGLPMDVRDKAHIR